MVRRKSLTCSVTASVSSASDTADTFDRASGPAGLLCVCPKARFGVGPRIPFLQDHHRLGDVINTSKQGSRRCGLPKKALFQPIQDGHHFRQRIAQIPGFDGPGKRHNRSWLFLGGGQRDRRRPVSKRDNAIIGVVHLPFGKTTSGKRPLCSKAAASRKAPMLVHSRLTLKQPCRCSDQRSKPSTDAKICHAVSR